jgi:phosphoribosyl-ATP pyrophosphohydrolase/phosphoribosyl-AMP cyclohydrolase
VVKNIVNRIDWKKIDLLPCIVQDHKSRDVLMLAFMNKEALDLTLRTKKAHYFSRTKQRIWQKGESSGNIQNIKDIYVDCDSDTLLLKVEQVGGITCHTGRKSCFFTKLESNDIVEEVKNSPVDSYGVIDRLYHELKTRRFSDPSVSYTASLLKKGENSYLKKVVEEAGEFCFAIKDGDQEQIVYECADMLYHTLVALVDRDIDPDMIRQELHRRFGLSGIEEKKSR